MSISQPVCTAHSSDCIAPVKATPDSAGFDLGSIEEVEIPPGGRRVVSTGLSVSCPDGTYGRIAPRSGLSVKHGITVLGGVIDPDYRGVVKAILHNTSTEPFTVEIGMKVCQLIFEEYRAFPATKYMKLVFAGDDHTAEMTERGSRGFGSSGL